MPWQNLLHAGEENLLSGLTALTAEFTVGKGELMTHDGSSNVVAQNECHDLTSGMFAPSLGQTRAGAHFVELLTKE